MTARRKPVADEARLLNLLLKGEFAAFGKESGLSIRDLGRMMRGEDEPDDDFDLDDEDYPDDDEEDWWLRPEWLRPEWLHPDCLNACLALELGTCCRYPDNPLVRAAVDLASMVEAALARLGRDDCPATAAELARLFRFIPGLLAQVHAILPRLNATAVAQFRCPVGRLAGALDLICAGGCPWACGDPAVPDRRAEFDPLRPLLAECATALRTALGQGQGVLETSTWVGDTRCLREADGRPPQFIH